MSGIRPRAGPRPGCFREETSVSSARTTSLTAELPPGNYQLIASVRVDDETAEGEAHYDFYDVAVE